MIADVPKRSKRNRSRRSSKPPKATQVPRGTAASNFRTENHTGRTEASRRARRTAVNRFSLLALLTVACLLLLIGCAFLVPPAFSSPPPNFIDLGAANVLVEEGGGLTADQQATLRAGLIVTAEVSQLSPSVGYEISFPPALAGKKFLLALSGSAVLSNIRSKETALQTRITRCPKVGIPAEDRIPQTCQLISGQVPTLSDETTGVDICDPGKKDTESIPVRIEGRGKAVSSPDWAHHLTSFPDLRNPTTKEFSMSQWGNIVLPTRYLLSQQHGCFLLSKNPNWTDFTPNVTPNVNVGDTAAWTPYSTEFTLISVVNTERSAAWKGNLLIAFIGIVGGGLLGLLVATVKAGKALVTR
jgi:hypothetical protein